MDGRSIQGGVIFEQEAHTCADEQHEVEATLLGFLQALVGEQGLANSKEDA